MLSGSVCFHTSSIMRVLFCSLDNFSLCRVHAPEAISAKVWENTTFDGDQTGERRTKFLKLMGFKGPITVRYAAAYLNSISNSIPRPRQRMSSFTRRSSKSKLGRDISGVYGMLSIELILSEHQT